MNLAARMSLDTRGFSGPLAGAERGMSSFLGFTRRLIAPLALVTAGLLGTASAAGLVHRSIAEAATMEDLQTSFVTLLGSMDAAKDRMTELAKFAAETPFELEGIAQASRVLETLTQGALATGQGLRMAGDLAAATGQPFSELAVHVGRLYDGLQNGTAVGESLMRLTELGIITGSVRREIEALQKSGAAGPQIWAVAENAFARFSGEMERRSRTWNGLMSTFKDTVSEVLREFGTPVIDGLKPFLTQSIQLVAQLSSRAKQLGEQVKQALLAGFQAMRSGQMVELFGLALASMVEMAAAASRNLGETLFGGMDASKLVAGFGAVASALAQLTLNAFRPVVQVLIAGAIMAGRKFASSIQDALPDWLKKHIQGDALQQQLKDAGLERAQLHMRRDITQAQIADGVGDPANNQQVLQRLNTRIQALDQIIGSGGITFADAMQSAGQVIDGVAADAGQNFKTALGNLVGVLIPENATAELKVKLAELYGAYQEATETLKAQTTAAVGTQSAGGALAGGLSGGAGFRPEVDALQRIGGFVGGVGPATDHERRTADNTARTVSLLQEIKSKFFTNPSPTAAWA